MTNVLGNIESYILERIQNEDMFYFPTSDVKGRECMTNYITYETKHIIPYPILILSNFDIEVAPGKSTMPLDHGV